MRGDVSTMRAVRSAILSGRASPLRTAVRAKKAGLHTHGGHSPLARRRPAARARPPGAQRWLRTRGEPLRACAVCSEEGGERSDLCVVGHPAPGSPSVGWKDGRSRDGSFTRWVGRLGMVWCRGAGCCNRGTHAPTASTCVSQARRPAPLAGARCCRAPFAFPTGVAACCEVRGALWRGSGWAAACATRERVGWPVHRTVQHAARIRPRVPQPRGRVDCFQAKALKALKACQDQQRAHQGNREAWGWNALSAGLCLSCRCPQARAPDGYRTPWGAGICALGAQVPALCRGPVGPPNPPRAPRGQGPSVDLTPSRTSAKGVRSTEEACKLNRTLPASTGPFPA